LIKLFKPAGYDNRGHSHAEEVILSTYSLGVRCSKSGFRRSAEEEIQFPAREQNFLNIIIFARRLI